MPSLCIQEKTNSWLIQFHRTPLKLVFMDGMTCCSGIYGYMIEVYKLRPSGRALGYAQSDAQRGGFYNHPRESPEYTFS